MNAATPANIQIFTTPARTLADIRGDLADILNRGQEVSRERLAEVVKDLDKYLEQESR